MKSKKPKEDRDEFLRGFHACRILASARIMDLACEITTRPERKLSAKDTGLRSGYVTAASFVLMTKPPRKKKG